TVTRASSKPGRTIRSTIPLISLSGFASRLSTSCDVPADADAATTLVRIKLRRTRDALINPPIFEPVPCHALYIESRLAVRNGFHKHVDVIDRRLSKPSANCVLTSIVSRNGENRRTVHHVQLLVVLGHSHFDVRFWLEH